MAVGPCAIFPMKSFASAKTRLRPCLDDCARAELARAMFLRALDASLRCDLVDATYVVTNGSDVAELVRAAGAHVLWDPAPAMSLGALMDWALARLRDTATRAVILMSDLPQIESRDIAQLCRLLDTQDCIMVPDRRGQSTNALALRLPFPGPTAFGLPDSYRQHVVRARGLGLRSLSLAHARLGHDVDVPEDLWPAGTLGAADVSPTTGPRPLSKACGPT